jgi:hypothetical protein
MSKMQRTKGATWERELARYLTDHGLVSKRGIGQARSATEVPDVDLPGYWVEAKRHKRTSPRKALEQAVADSAKSGRVPVAVCRDNGTSADEAMVTMRLADWVVLVASLRAVGGAVADIRDEREGGT